MSLKQNNREVAYTRAIQICQNLARLTVYELIGGQILLPREGVGTALRPSPLVLLPVVDEPSAGAVEAVAKIGTTFVAVKSTLDTEGDQQIEFLVLVPKKGKTTRHGNLRAWADTCRPKIGHRYGSEFGTSSRRTCGQRATSGTAASSTRWGGC